MTSQHAPRYDAALAQLVDQGASAAQIAEALLGHWRRIEAALAPIVGQRGVAALFARTLHLAGRDHAWLIATPASTAGPIDTDALHTALCGQSAATAAVAGDAFINHFTALLTSLIGPSLADHLIGPLRQAAPSGEAAQDT